MKIGTKSLLFGAHTWWIHPWFVAAAWTKLYGFPRDPRLWVAFLVHDWGYWGKPNMDGPEGETHVELGARIMHRLFDRDDPKCAECHGVGRYMGVGYSRSGEPYPTEEYCSRCNRWAEFALYHSRFYAKRDNKQFSRLCVADKLAIVLTPWWLYLLLATATGELTEYMTIAQGRENAYDYGLGSENPKEWYLAVQSYIRKWVEEHRYDLGATFGQG